VIEADHVRSFRATKSVTRETVTKGRAPAPRKSADVAVRADLVDAVVVRIRNDDVALPVHRHVTWIMKVGLHPLPVAEVIAPAPRKSADVAVRADLADAVVVSVPRVDPKTRGEISGRFLQFAIP
jgi:hypothetical protein